MTEFETLVKAEVVTGLALTTSRSLRVGGGAVPKIDKFVLIVVEGHGINNVCNLRKLVICFISIKTVD